MFFVGVMVIQIAINVDGGIGTYSGVLSNLQRNITKNP
jgi:hypothetical protein